MFRFKLVISMLLVMTVLLPAVDTVAKNNEGKPFTVVIDAGHGGKDIGAADNGAREKDINLGVALQLEKLLKKKLKDAEVIMTRDDDTYLTLQQRADVANKAKGDLFISIHTNSVDKKNRNRKTVAGSSVYALGLHKDDNNMRVARRENSVIELESNYEQKYSGFDPNKDESYIIFEMAQKKNLSKSIRFAEEIQKELVGIGRKNRGVHQAGFWVLWATSMPSVLIELDFICNPNSAEYMTSRRGEKEFAEGIYKAVKRYYENWSNNSGSRLASNENAEEDAVGVSNVPAEKAESESVVGDGYAVKLARVERSDRSSRPSSPRSAYANARRRRRNDRSKTLSSGRNVEAALIPLHTEEERDASLVSLVETKTPDEVVSSDEETVADKKGKQKKKKEKKEKKAKVKKEKKKRNANAHNAKIEKFVTVYKIQILASADLLKQNNARFCGLSPISTYKENSLYKYYYGESTDKEEIESLLKDVKKLIPDAFVVSATKSIASAKK